VSVVRGFSGSFSPLAQAGSQASESERQSKAGAIDRILLLSHD
jgi:hypothetical protein